MDGEARSAVKTNRISASLGVNINATISRRALPEPRRQRDEHAPHSPTTRGSRPVRAYFPQRAGLSPGSPSPMCLRTAPSRDAEAKLTLCRAILARPVGGLRAPLAESARRLRHTGQFRRHVAVALSIPARPVITSESSRHNSLGYKTLHGHRTSS